MYSKRRGFTLIELLVVIAIIAILAAILFPVFARAKAKARQITCLSNVKQIAVSVMMYMSDWDDIYPRAEINHRGAPYGPQYPPLYHPVTGEEMQLNQTKWFWDTWYQPPWRPDLTVAGGLMTPYVQNLEILACPDWQADINAICVNFQSYGGNCNLGYLMEGNGCPDRWGIASQSVSAAHTEDPTNTILFGDCYGNGYDGVIYPPCWGTWYGATTTCGYGMRAAYGRHAARYDADGNLTGGIINYAFCDGHAKATDAQGLGYKCADGTWWDYYPPNTDSGTYDDADWITIW